MTNKFLGLPYPVINHPLGFFRTTFGLDQIKSDILVLLLTNPGERVMLSNYGTPLRTQIFNPNDPTTKRTIKQMIINSINLFEPRIVVDQIEVLDKVDLASLSKDDPRQDIDNIVQVKIKLFDPQNISEVEELVLEIPLAGG